MENNSIIKLTYRCPENLVSVLNYSAWPFLLLHFSAAILGKSASAVSSSFIFHFHQLTLIYPCHTEYFPDGKYNYSSQMNFQEKNTCDICPNSSDMSVSCIKQWRIWVNADLHLLDHEVVSPFFTASYFLPREWYKEKMFL